MSDTIDDREWDSGWEGHSRAQQERLAKLPFSEKLAWLEEMHHMLEAMKRSKAQAEVKPEHEKSDVEIP